MSRWLHIKAERVLCVDRGVNVILLSRETSTELVLQLSDSATDQLHNETSMEEVEYLDYIVRGG